MLPAVLTSNFLRQLLFLIGTTAKLLKWLLLVLIMLVLITTGTILGSEKGRIWLVYSLINQLNRSTDLDITLEELAIPTLDQWYVDRLQVKKQQQDWFNAEQLALHWQPRALLGQSFVIDQLIVDKLSLHHFFSTALSKKEDREIEHSVITTLPNIKIGQLMIAVMDIYDIPLSINDGKKLSYTVNTEINWLQSSPLSIHLKAQGLDDRAAQLNLRLQSKDRAHITLNGSLHEPANGMFGQLLKLPKKQGIDAGFEATITADENRYTVAAQRISLPLLQHQIEAQGELILSKERNMLVAKKLDLNLSTDDTQHAIFGSFSEQQLHAELKLNKFPLDVISLWNDSVSDGELTTELTFSGTADSPYAEGKITASTTYQQIPMEIDFTGILTKKLINIDNLSARFSTPALLKSELWAKGKLDLESNKSALNITIKNLHTKTLKQLNLSVPSKLDATVISATANLKGSVLDLPKQLNDFVNRTIKANTEDKNTDNTINGTLEIVARGSYKQQAFSTRGKFIKNGNTVVVHDTTITTGIATTKLQGQLQENILKAKISAYNIETKTLRLLNIPVPDKLNGNVSDLTADIKGSVFDFPKRLNGNVQIKAKGDYQQKAFSLQGKANKNDGTITIHDATITADSGATYIQGQIQQDTLEANLNINTESLPLGLLALAGQEIPEALDAKMDAQLLVQGHLLRPQVSGDVALSGSYEETPISLIAKGQYQNSNIQLEQLNLATNGELVLSANGSYQNDQFKLHAYAKKLPTQLLSTLGWHIQPGKFSADIHAFGTVNNPDINGSISYQAMLSGYNEEGEKKDIDFSWDVDINTHSDSLNIISTITRSNAPSGELFITIPKKTYLKYSAKKSQTSAQENTTRNAQNAHNIPIDAAISGHFNLQTLSFFINPDLHRLTGKAETNIMLSGTLEKPKISGFLQLNNSRYENPASGTLIESIDCRVNAEQTQFEFGDCRATDGVEGNYQLTGRIHSPTHTSKNNSPGLVELHLLAKNANILRRPEIESEATGEITLSGDFSSLLASGTLELSPLTIILDSTSSHGIPIIQIEEANLIDDQKSEKSDKLITVPPINFNLRLTANNQAFLRGRGLDAELKGQIDLTGNLDKPRYDGNVETVRGVFKLFNKKFKLSQGEINFNNNALSVAVKGTYKKNGQRIDADLSGTQDNLTLSLSSVPPMAEDEILAFMVFGKSIQQITPFQAIQLAAAVQSLRGGANGSFDPIGSTRELLHIDTLSIDSTTTKDGGNGVNIGVGKYLNERVYLEVERTPNPSQPWRGNLEIELTPNINVESSTGGNTGIEGAELKWKKDY